MLNESTQISLEKPLDGGVPVIKVTGCLDTAATENFTSAVQKYTQGAWKVGFDFSELVFIASSALRTLVSLHKRLVPLGGTVVITGLSASVRETFNITGLAEIFSFAG